MNEIMEDNVSYEKKITNIPYINEDLMDKETNTDPGNTIIDIREEDIANNSEDHTRESDVRNRNRQITNINSHKNEKKRKLYAKKKEETEDKEKSYKEEDRKPKT